MIDYFSLGEILESPDGPTEWVGNTANTSDEICSYAFFCDWRRHIPLTLWS